ncbi:glycoside hydrolase family 1 protein [Microbulbifer sp. SH-1]|uniref:glycoside hydrolase family 1 protein n=1 Tax=Microbulbifer sp. SH-1 TaxID=2681547 RepID=UPI001408E3B1|nr:family 1 glycosylhydrolase [Microbulbifer sp. SH-1]
MTVGFPEGFIWGAATAAHQVEGGNSNSDAWVLEHAVPSIFREPSGDAIDHWNRFEDDVALLAALGLRAYRFSIEWARIEPREGVFSRAAIDHYQRCINACLERGVQPIPTFHHFTAPIWVARDGGLTSAKFPERFARYCEKVARELSGFQYACTINELNLPLFMREKLVAAVNGDLKAAAEAALGSSLDSFFLFSPREAILKQGLKAHALARDAIKAQHPNCQVGATLSIQDEQAESGAEAFRDERNAQFYDECLDALKNDDFIGVQTYTRLIARKDGSATGAEGAPRTMIGWEDYPQALANTCRYVFERTGAPIVITENGWAGLDDTRRSEFIREALQGVHHAIQDGVDVRGYLYWTLFDNYEWMSGYEPKFGLIGVDRNTQARKIKPSALVLGDIAQNNSLVAPDIVPTPTRNFSPDQESSPVGIG